MNLYQQLFLMLVVYIATLCVAYLFRKPLQQWHDSVIQKLHPYKMRTLITWLLGVVSITIVIVKLLWEAFTRGLSLMELLQQIGAYGILLGLGWLVWLLVLLVLLASLSSLGILTFPLAFLEAYAETRDAQLARAQASSVSSASLRLPWRFYLIEGALCGGALIALMWWLT